MINNDIRILRSIDHLYISKLHEYFNIKNDQGEKLTVLIERYFLSLHEYVAVKGFKDEMIKRRIEKGILQAIGYLQNQIIHHNICQDNIYLDDNLNPKLSGFGASMNLKHKLSFYEYAYLDEYYVDAIEINFLHLLIIYITSIDLIIYMICGHLDFYFFISLQSVYHFIQRMKLNLIQRNRSN